MHRKKFLKQSTIVSVGISTVPSILLSCNNKSNDHEESESDVDIIDSKTVFTLPEIPYGYNAFPDVIDARTMEIHHSRHHQGYTDKLNNALAEANISGKNIEDILSGNNLPTAIRNNGGGYYNHNLYWEILTPGGNMSSNFEDKITADFGSKETFLNEITEAGLSRFGSGWAWVYQDADKKLHIGSTPNQDNPLMQISEIQGHPILGIDVWEHAYYLKYQNRRGEYLRNLLTIINWEKVEARMI